MYLDELNLTYCRIWTRNCHWHLVSTVQPSNVLRHCCRLYIYNIIYIYIGTRDLNVRCILDWHALHSIEAWHSSKLMRWAVGFVDALLAQEKLLPLERPAIPLTFYWATTAWNQMVEGMEDVQFHIQIGCFVQGKVVFQYLKCFYIFPYCAKVTRWKKRFTETRKICFDRNTTKHHNVLKWMFQWGAVKMENTSNSTKG